MWLGCVTGQPTPPVTDRHDIVTGPPVEAVGDVTPGITWRRPRRRVADKPVEYTLFEWTTTFRHPQSPRPASDPARVRRRARGPSARRQRNASVVNESGTEVQLWA